MKTEVVMQRELFGKKVAQKSKSEFLSATDLFLIGNRERVLDSLKPVSISDYYKNSKNKEFLSELEIQYGKIKSDGRGKSHSWVHPLLFMDMALWLSPKLKVKVYEWLQDNLLSYRNDSGDSYKKMVGSLYDKATDKTNFKKNMSFVARRIALECGVQLKEKRWETASENQLKLRDKMHEYIALFCDITKNANDAIELGILKAKEAQNG